MFWFQHQSGLGLISTPQMKACRMQTISELWEWTNLVFKWDNHLGSLKLVNSGRIFLMLLFFLWRHWCSLLKKSSHMNSSFIWQNVEIEFNGLNLAIQNRACRTWDVNFLNSFKNMLTIEMVWKWLLFKKKNPNYLRVEGILGIETPKKKTNLCCKNMIEF